MIIIIIIIIIGCTFAENLQPRSQFFQSGLNLCTKSNLGYQACKNPIPAAFDGFLTSSENLAYQSPDSFNDAVD